jgi:tetratricopeptide (TPR) repeat protein
LIPENEIWDETQDTFPALKECVRFVRSFVPESRKVVCLFFPLAVQDGEAYWRTIRYLHDHLSGSEEQGVRLIARDDVEQACLTEMDPEPDVLIYQPQIDPDSVEKSLQDKANDPKVPVEEQAQMHMMLAGMDMSRGRHESALARNQEVLGYFRHTGQRHQESVVLNNIGDIYYLRGQYRDCRLWYEQAANLSLKLASAPLLLYQTMNLGNCLYRMKRYPECLEYYRSSAQLAEAQQVPLQQIQALERIGVVHHEGREWDQAIQSWEEAVTLSRQIEYEEGVKTNLQHLKRLYRDKGDVQRLRECEKELTAMRKGTNRLS